MNALIIIMLKDRRKIVVPIIKNKHALFDNGAINHYIIGQIKRKIEPFFMRKVIKYKAEDGSPFMANHKQCQDHIALKSIQNKIDSMTQRKTKKHGRMQRISSQINLQTIIDPHELESEDSGDEVADQNGQKYERLKEKVYLYLREQKFKLKKLRQQQENDKKTGLLRQSSACFLTQTQNKSAILKSQFSLSNFSQNISKIQKPIVRFEKNKGNASPSSQLEVLQKGQRLAPKSSKKFLKSLRKQSSMNIEQKIDEVDIQFEQGLIEQIYTKKRINFRKKIHENKSKSYLTQSTDNYG